MEKIINKIAEELNVKNTQVENAVKLIDEGNTIPFIARYRKEATGGLSDEILRDLGLEENNFNQRAVRILAYNKSNKQSIFRTQTIIITTSPSHR